MENKITHDELIAVGRKWLTKTIGARFTLSELATAAMEIPDIIGWKSGFSILIECKTSRADFLADKKKFFRRFPYEGMGTYRLYLCPTGLIHSDELPKGWGLLFYDPDKKGLERIVCWKGNIVANAGKLKAFHPHYKNEVAMLVSYIARNKND